MYDGKVSIVVPLFNAEKYIDKCINSVLNQTYKNLELIIVDDGSTDNSAAIIEQIIQVDKRVIYYSQENAGPSSARNKGIDLAKGEFLFFLDADDYLENKSIEKLVDSSFECDLIIGGYRNLYNNNEKEIIPRQTGKFHIEEFHDIFPYLFSNNFFHYTWNKLYRREVVKNTRFDTKLKIGEDLVFNLEYFKKTYKLNIIPEVICNHIKTNSESITTNYQSYLFETRKLMYNSLISYAESSFNGKDNIIELASRWYLKMIKYCFFNLHRRDAKLSNEDKILETTRIINDKSVRESMNFLKVRQSSSLLILAPSTFALNGLIDQLYYNFIIKKKIRSLLIFSKMLFIVKSK